MRDIVLPFVTDMLYDVMVNFRLYKHDNFFLNKHKSLHIITWQIREKTGAILISGGACDSYGKGGRHGSNYKGQREGGRTFEKIGEPKTNVKYKCNLIKVEVRGNLKVDIFQHFVN